ncbi:MAG: hypothetical protein A3C70_00015 [Candidatus Zambryskibacteria bacterium RIFCSPHIGHO2_02_FULL_43_14]|uniref:Dockerin domain-containing protein n=1 Tax=Candidatus Zambryskibacteria bacterium RIFCSPHIGHO2_02_FULL_43_14 TaxID=1802748 RepID=A0A1G2TEW6_9BACT|nr:MAG: hypothetical protein A2829_03065 [Candidatus Zambryskibacteria bacterium RIFCSPHIGHO2_01_FULL_43_60]OHA95837.1 MAG: hypothetical protein A3C70_00015 [Candidatus Zambryskibacteria bacterium RIFCSPHIGHO2_02_FULL_43_14]OHB03373.1 MAG: hypothetical protein A3B03_02195 [Candidatus Zambryskibacteria bacterium RIFCSPLOWO2_01_FULL_42_41]
MKKIGFFAIILFATLIAFLQTKAQTANLSDSDFEIETFASGLSVPWSMDFFPDGRMIFTERTGAVKLRESSGAIQTIGQVTSLYSGSETGVMGLAVDPDFGSNNYIYIQYTRTTGNRISRFIFNGTSLTNETVILDNIPAASNHDGGRLAFGPDGKLYSTTGDAVNAASAQNTNSLAGKILRLNKDGSIPGDNPFGNLVWTYGHRNPQGIAWNPSNGSFYAAEHGNNSNDELNLAVKGNNYGWPDIECNESDPNIKQPIRCFSEFTLAPSGIAVYQGDIYMAGLRGKQIRRVVVDNNNNLVMDQALFQNFGRLRGIVAHDGWLYFSTSNKDGRGTPASNDDRIFRIRLKSASLTPPISTLKGDLNRDGIVNSLDWSIMNSKWFTSDSAADLNSDGIVNSLDFSIMNGNWLKSGLGSSHVTLKEGQREGPFILQKIYADYVTGLNYPEYPVAVNQGYPVTLKIGETASNGCTITLTLASIQGDTATFAKIMDLNRPCPICLAEDTLIDTPFGSVRVKNLQTGMSVWTAGKEGDRVLGSVIKTSKVQVSPSHQMARLILDDGRELLVSPGHPTSDGRTVGDLRPGDLYDGALVASVERVSYDDGATYDILPSGNTGFYWANGILLGSTLHIKH